MSRRPWSGLTLIALIGGAVVARAGARATVIFHDDFERDNPWTFSCRGVGQQKLDPTLFYRGKRALGGVTDRFELLHLRPGLKFVEANARLSFWCYADYEPGDAFWTRLVVGVSREKEKAATWVSLDPPPPRQWIQRVLRFDDISPSLAGASITRLAIGLRGRGTEFKLWLDEVLLENRVTDPGRANLAPVPPPSLLAGPLAWAAADKVRALYVVPGRDQGRSYRDLFQSPVNAVLLGAQDAGVVVEWAGRCTAYNKHLYLVLPAFPSLAATGANRALRRAQFADGLEDTAVCPRDARYWEGPFGEAMESIAELAALVRIEGVLFDLRLPAGSVHSGYAQMESCLCDDCFDGFLRDKRSQERAEFFPVFARREFLVRRNWLREYAVWEEAAMIELARSAARRLRLRHPQFVLGIFSFDDSWLARGLATGFASAGVPALLASSEPARTEGHNLRVHEATLAARQLGFPALFLPGLTPERWGRNLPEHMVRCGLTADGFWVTVPPPEAAESITRLGEEIRLASGRLRARLEAAAATRKSAKK